MKSDAEHEMIPGIPEALRRRWMLALILAALASCHLPDGFECRSDLECDLEPNGRCWDRSSGHGSCAYPDPACDTGYAWHSGRVCVASIWLPDASPLDAPVDSSPADAIVDAAVDAPGVDSSMPPKRCYIDLSSGMDDSCGLLADTTIVCWGTNSPHGEASSPGGTGFKSVRIGMYHSCGLRSTGTALCWGSNTSGERDVPAGTYLDIAAGPHYTCAIRGDDMKITCWGDPNNDAVKAANIPSGTFNSIVAGEYYACAVGTNGDVKCWGANMNGVLATPSSGVFKKVSAGLAYACALDTTGNVQCWGTAITVAPPAGPFLDVSVGYKHVCAIRADKRMDCWGSNDGGEGTEQSGAFDQVAAGYSHTCWVRADDGHVVCFGKEGGACRGCTKPPLDGGCPM